MRTPAPLAALLFLVTTTSTACYQSNVSAGGPALPIDSSLLGTWEEIDPEASPTIVKVEAASGTEYVIDVPGKRGATSHFLHARAFLTRAGNATFVNLREPDAEDPRFLILRFTRHSDTSLSLATLKETVPSFRTADELQTYLAEHAGDADLVQDELHLRKVSAR